MSAPRSYNQRSKIPKVEFSRKVVHLSSLWMPISYNYFPEELMLKIFAAITLGLLVFDVLRISSLQMGRKLREMLAILRLDSILFREREKNTLSGGAYMMISATICATIFQKNIFILSFLILILSDTAAAIIGQKFGRRRICGKTYIGSIAFFLCSIAIVLLSSSYVFNENKDFLVAAVYASVFATLVELVSNSLKIDDNFSIPVCFGALMWVIV